MTKARNIADLLDANGDVKTDSLDNVPASNDASALTTGTLDNARLPSNISDSGTEGTRVATGTSAQRGSTQGQLRFNTDTGLAEYYTGNAFKSIDSPPTISGVGASNITESQINSNYDLSITGSSFNSGATVKFIGADNTEYASPTVTVNSETSITARVPTSVTSANEPFGVKVTNTSSLSSTLSSAFNVDAKPVWQTASGNINSSVFDDSSSGTVHATVSATDDEGDTVSYSETTSTLSGAGFSLNSSNGQITGDPNNVSSDTTVSFDLRATSGTQTTDRSFSMIVKQGISQTDLIGHYSFKSGDSYSGSGSTVTNIYTGSGALGNGTLYSGGSTGAVTYNSSTGYAEFNNSGASQRQGLLIPAPSTISGITIQMLIDFTHENNAGGRSYIVDFRRSGSSGEWYWLYDGGGNGSTELTMNNGASAEEQGSFANIGGGLNQVIPNNGYLIHTCRIDASSVSWRVGKPDGSYNNDLINSSGLSGSTVSNGEIMVMGIDPTYGGDAYWSRGRIKQILIYDAKLSASTVDSNASVLGARY